MRILFTEYRQKRKGKFQDSDSRRTNDLKKTDEIAKKLGMSVADVKKILGENNVKDVIEFTSSQIKDLQKSYADLKGKTISPEKATALSKHLDRIELNDLRKLVKVVLVV